MNSITSSPGLHSRAGAPSQVSADVGNLAVAAALPDYGLVPHTPLAQVALPQAYIPVGQLSLPRVHKSEVVVTPPPALAKSTPRSRTVSFASASFFVCFFISSS